MSAVRPTIRVRLTALYGALFAGSTVLLMALSYWLMRGHLHRTLPETLADQALSQLATQYGIALIGSTLLALALGWAMAGRVLAPLKTITATARRVSQDRLGERIALRGRPDELHELADTFDAMLDRLGEAFEAQRRFIANASHELRSPLTVIRTEADVALADPRADRHELRAMGEAVLEATDRTDALLESLMLLARSQRGLLRTEPLDLADAARAAEEPILGEAAERRVAVRPALRTAPVTGDQRLLERLVGNLLENAVRHNHRGGFAEVSTWTEGDEVRVRVVNSGSRLDPATVARLVEPFERGGRHGEARGAGLGLSIVRSVADVHGGTLQLAPRPGGGLVAEVALPAGG